MNMIHSEHVRLSLEDKKTRLNNNVLIVGGAGTGKSRFVMKPNLLQETAVLLLPIHLANCWAVSEKK